MLGSLDKRVEVTGEWHVKFERCIRLPGNESCNPHRADA